MAARIAGYDWAATPLGAMHAWPSSLRTAVNLCLNSRFPMFIWWGPSLINIYNDAYTGILGKRHPDGLGRAAPDLWHEIWDVVGPQAEAVLSRGESTWNECVRLDVERQGYVEETYFTWSYSPIHDETGNIGGLFCVVTEETARVLAERERDRLAEQRKRDEERARTILESITDAFFAIDADWVFTYVNPQGQRLLGRMDLVDRVIWEEYPAIEGTPFEAIYRQAATQRVTASTTAYYPDHDRWYEVHAYPAPGGGISVYFRDASDHQRAEAAVRESEERLRLAVAIAQIGTFEIDLKTDVVRVNDTGRDIYGWAADEPLTFTRVQSHFHPDDAPGVQREVGIALRPDGPREFEVEQRIIRTNGAVRWIRVRGRALFEIVNGVEQAYRCLGTYLDVTAAKEAEQQREQLLASERAARLEAERAGRMKDEFLATLSHELRTPLNAILGWSQIIGRTGDASEDVKQGLEVIERNARAQAQIIEDLLDMSRIISGKVRLDLQQLDLPAVVRTAIETARPTAQAKGVVLRAVIDPLDNVAVRGDSGRLQQVLWNLLSNAIKFTPKGGHVQVVLARVNSHLELNVTDTGEGITVDFLPFVFDRFRQADASTTRRHGGLGLGLSIVKQLVELHGGSVSVSSAGEGMGAQFTVSLPLMAAHPRPLSTTEPRHPRAAGQRAEMDPCGQLKGVRVLVIDDEPDARQLLKRVLEDCAAAVTTTASTNEAVDLIRTGAFDVLVSDIGMPGEDGYALIRRVRLLGPDHGGNIPAIALTAYARVEDRIKAIAAGFQTHVAKPVEPAELVTLVAGVTGHTGPNAA
ncbi:MAG TPA: ATP-binding protein [Tepidisphaeraceae bacterium]|jgi:hypothetical protein